MARKPTSKQHARTKGKGTTEHEAVFVLVAGARDVQEAIAVPGDTPAPDLIPPCIVEVEAACERVVRAVLAPLDPLDPVAWFWDVRRTLGATGDSANGGCRGSLVYMFSEQRGPLLSPEQRALLRNPANERGLALNPANVLGPLPAIQFWGFHDDNDPALAPQARMYVRAMALRVVGEIRDRIARLREAVLPTVTLYGDRDKGGPVRVGLAGTLRVTDALSASQWTFLDDLRKHGTALFWKRSAHDRTNGGRGRRMGDLLRNVPELDAVLRRDGGHNTNRDEYSVEPAVRKRIKASKATRPR